MLVYCNFIIIPGHQNYSYSEYLGEAWLSGQWYMYVWVDYMLQISVTFVYYQTHVPCMQEASPKKCFAFTFVLKQPMYIHVYMYIVVAYVSNCV